MADHSPSTSSKSSQERARRKHGSDFDSKRHSRRKRPPSRPNAFQRINDIYINRRTNFSQQLARCHKLLDQGCSEVTIHGLGAAINRAINLGLQLRETTCNDLQIAVTTSTVEVTDDMEPLEDDEEHYTRVRSTSAIHIRLSQPPAAITNKDASSQPPPPPPNPPVARRDSTGAVTMATSSHKEVQRTPRKL